MTVKARPLPLFRPVSLIPDSSIKAYMTLLLDSNENRLSEYNIDRVVHYDGLAARFRDRLSKVLNDRLGSTWSREQTVVDLGPDVLARQRLQTAFLDSALAVLNNLKVEHPDFELDVPICPRRRSEQRAKYFEYDPGLLWLRSAVYTLPTGDVGDSRSEPAGTTGWPGISRGYSARRQNDSLPPFTYSYTARPPTRRSHPRETAYRIVDPDTIRPRAPSPFRWRSQPREEPRVTVTRDPEWYYTYATSRRGPMRPPRSSHWEYHCPEDTYRPNSRLFDPYKDLASNRPPPSRDDRPSRGHPGYRRTEVRVVPEDLPRRPTRPPSPSPYTGSDTASSQNGSATFSAYTPSSSGSTRPSSYDREGSHAPHRHASAGSSKRVLIEDIPFSMYLKSLYLVASLTDADIDELCSEDMLGLEENPKSEWSIVKKLRERAHLFTSPDRGDYLELKQAEDLESPSIAARRLEDAAREVLLDMAMAGKGSSSLDVTSLREFQPEGDSVAMSLNEDEEIQNLFSHSAGRRHTSQ